MKVMLCLLFAVSAACAGPAIVEARVQSIETEKDGTALVARLVVTEVYDGPASLAGRTFLALTSNDGAGGRNAIIRPALRAGENGLWALGETDGRLYGIASDYRSRSWPVIEGREHGFVRLRQELRIERELNTPPAKSAAP